MKTGTPPFRCDTTQQHCPSRYSAACNTRPTRLSRFLLAATFANQFRLLLVSLAYVLMERLRAIGLAGIDLTRAEVGTIRVRLLKLGAVIVRNTRRVRSFLASAFPHQNIFRLAAKRIMSG